MTTIVEGVKACGSSSILRAVKVGGRAAKAS
jgi:hypothetical protein